MDAAGFGQRALASLTPTQVDFIQSLPKAELHAHLNGCIPLSVLQDLSKEYKPHTLSSEAITKGLAKLDAGVDIHHLDDFFSLFPAIYALTSTPDALAKATQAVLSTFLDGEKPQCTYLELRSTPKKTGFMSRMDYIRTVLSEVEKYPRTRAGYIVSIDRRMSDEDMQECVDIAVTLKNEGRRVVGIDLCGDPQGGSAEKFRPHFAGAREAGLKLTLHIAETIYNTPEETLQLLSFHPDRLGHATFLDEEAKRIVLENNIPIEICLSSNLLCKTVSTLEDHHIRFYLKHNHPISVCTDDILPFRNSMLEEYALLLADKPLGLGLSTEEVKRIAEMSLSHTFASP